MRVSTQYCALGDLAFDIFNYLWGFIERSLAQEDFLLQEGPIPLRQTASQTRSETNTCGTADVGRANTPLSSVSTRPSSERSFNYQGMPENKRVNEALSHNNLPRPASRIFEEAGEQTEYTLPYTPQWLDATQNSYCHQPLTVLRHLNRQPEQIQMDTGPDILNPQATPEPSSQTSPQHTDTNQNTFIQQQQQHKASSHLDRQPDQTQIDGATGDFDPRPYLPYMPIYDIPGQFSQQNSDMSLNTSNQSSHLEPTRLPNHRRYTQMGTVHHIRNPQVHDSLVESNACSNDSDAQKHRQSSNELQSCYNS